MKILFFTHLTEEFSNELSRFEKKHPSCQIVGATSREQYEKEIVDSKILVYGNPEDREIERAEALELILVPYAGVSQLNFDLLRRRSVRVANSHGNAAIVAERALGLAMACCGRIVEFHNDMGKGFWHRTGDRGKPFDYWFSMRGKKVSILGTGAIGRSLAALLSGFNCNVLGFRKRASEKPEYFNAVTSDLDEALEHGEIIFIALPATGETENLLSAEKMPLLSGKYIINVGRGSILEEEPFFRALESGVIAGAGIDTWYLYPSREKPQSTGSEFPFYSLPNVVLSPHAASHAPEGKLGQLTGALDVIDRYVTDGAVMNEILGTY